MKKNSIFFLFADHFSCQLSIMMEKLPCCIVGLPSPLPSGEQCLKKQCCEMSYTQSSYLPKRKAQVWFCMVAHRQPHRCGLSNIDALAHLNNQCVEHKFLHFWIPKAKHKAKLILVITRPEWHKHHSHWLGGGGHFDHESSSLSSVLKYLGHFTYKALSCHVLYWLHSPEAF